MEKPNRQHIIGARLGVGVAALLIWGWDNEPETAYYHNEGPVFGTYYNIRYEASEDLEKEIQAALKAFDNSLSMFNTHSTLSAINANRDTITDSDFETMFREQGLPIYSAAWKSLPGDDAPLAPLTIPPEAEPREGIVRRT